MKRISLLLAVLCSASLAWAANTFVLGSATSNGSGVIAAPSSSTSGYALVQPDSMQALQVTISDVRDGSVGDALDSVLTGNAYAWCYPAAPTSASVWARFPALDVRMALTDAGTGIAGTGAFPSLTGMTSITTVGVACSRIAYTADTINASWDGGTLVYSLTVAEQL